MLCDSLSVVQKRTFIIHCDVIELFRSDSVSEMLVGRIM